MDAEMKYDKPIQVIFWEDHYREDRASFNDTFLPIPMVNLGWVLEEDKKRVVLCSHRNLDPEKSKRSYDGDVFVILKSNIIKRETIKK